MSVKLKPCPFCGSAAEIKGRKQVSFFDPDNKLEWWCDIRCSSMLECPAAKDKYTINEKLAIEKWNRRVGDE